MQDEKGKKGNRRGCQAESMFVKGQCDGEHEIVAEGSSKGGRGQRREVDNMLTHFADITLRS